MIPFSVAELDIITYALKDQAAIAAKTPHAIPTFDELVAMHRKVIRARALQAQREFVNAAPRT